MIDKHDYSDRIGSIEAENAKLRQLVRGLATGDGYADAVGKIPGECPWCGCRGCGDE